MRIDFYYWSYQCPLNYDMITVLQEYETYFDIHYYDISKNTPLAKAMKMYFPTLIVVEKTYRYYEPLTKTFLETLKDGALPKEEVYTPCFGTTIVKKTIEGICEDNLTQVCACTGGCSQQAIEAKKAFYKSLHMSIYGMYMHDKDHTMLGGAEYVPSLLVPYDIPKSEKTAFMTCLYPTDEVYDVKHAPLQQLENSLASSYNDVYVISDEKGNFPNGDIQFFLTHGYEDKGIVFHEPTYCTLHLMYKML